MVTTPSTASAPDLTFGWEKLSDLLADGVEALTKAHWREIAMDQKDVPLDVDWDQLLAEERAKRYRVFVARRGGKIAGYLPLMFFNPSRYQSTLFVQDDTVYVVPEERNRFAVWLGLFDRAIAELPRPCKLQIRLRPQHGGERIGAILDKRYGTRLTELVHTVVLK